MTHRPTIELGSFVVGEVPLPLDYQFLDSDGLPINLTGFTLAAFTWGSFIQGQFIDPTSELALVTDAVNGIVTYEWTGVEFAATGEHAGMFWVNDGTTQFGSILITWQVCQAVGTPPTV